VIAAGARRSFLVHAGRTNHRAPAVSHDTCSGGSSLSNSHGLWGPAHADPSFLLHSAPLPRKVFRESGVQETTRKASAKGGQG